MPTGNAHTCLHLAAAKRDLALLSFLMKEAGADTAARTAEGWNALHCLCARKPELTAANADAVMAKSRQIIAMLLDAGLLVNEATTCGRTALHWAVLSGDLGATEALLEAGANVFARVCIGSIAYVFVLEYGFCGVVPLLG